MLKKHLIKVILICFFFIWTSPVLAAQIKVQKGDSLWSIAKKYGTTVEKLKKANGLKSDLIRVGQILTIPDAKAANNSSSRETEKPASRGDQSRRDALVKFAVSLVGSKYKYGGESPAGFDCSGFVRYVYKQFGINLPHSSDAQYKSLSQKVDKASLVGGDLVFFSSGGRINHVGLYIGENKFVHASTPKTGVIISSLNESYYSARYKGARRVLD